jgi:hypothetical protein
MVKYSLGIMVDNRFKNNNNIAINDILGKEFEKYYDGWDYDVPKQLVNTVASKIKKYQGFSYEYRPMLP